MTGTDFDEVVGELRLPNKGTIKCAKSTHIRLMQQRHSLSGSKFDQKALHDTNSHFQQNSSTRAVLQDDATEAICLIRDCHRDVAIGTNRWNCKSR